MPSNSIAENVFGYLGVICWMIQLLPQIWKSWREKNTDGLSHWLVLLWAMAGPFLGTYVIVHDLNIPLMVQPQVLCAMSLVSWGQCQYYTKKRSKFVAITSTVSLAAILGGLETGMVFAIKSAYHDGVGNKRPVQFVGIFSTILISLALFPQYYEIWRYGEVVGISIVFMIVDLLGGLFSDLSLAFKSDLDAIAAISYSLVVVLDAVVIICALVLNPRATRKRQAAAVAEPSAAEVFDPPSAAITSVEKEKESEQSTV